MPPSPTSTLSRMSTVGRRARFLALKRPEISSFPSECGPLPSSSQTPRRARVDSRNPLLRNTLKFSTRHAETPRLFVGTPNFSVSPTRGPSSRGSRRFWRYFSFDAHRYLNPVGRSCTSPPIAIRNEKLILRCGETRRIAVRANLAHARPEPSTRK